MAGFDPDKAFAVTGMNSNEFNAICAIAIGKQGDANTLPENLKAGELPNDRMPIDEIIFEGFAK
jgi:hypothetical protein